MVIFASYTLSYSVHDCAKAE